jgi:hypothetical protein
MTKSNCPQIVPCRVLKCKSRTRSSVDGVVLVIVAVHQRLNWICQLMTQKRFGPSHILLSRFGQLDGSQVSAKGYGGMVIRPPKSTHLLALWPSYYYPSAPQNAFSPNAIKHYLHLPSVITEHIKQLSLALH